MKTLIAITMFFALSIPAHATIGGAKPRGYISPLVRALMIQQGIYQTTPAPVVPAAPIVVTPAPVPTAPVVLP